MHRRVRETKLKVSSLLSGKHKANISSANPLSILNISLLTVTPWHRIHHMAAWCSNSSLEKDHMAALSIDTRTSCSKAWNWLESILKPGTLKPKTEPAGVFSSSLRQISLRLNDKGEKIRNDKKQKRRLQQLKLPLRFSCELCNSLKISRKRRTHKSSEV